MKYCYIAKKKAQQKQRVATPGYPVVSKTQKEPISSTEVSNEIISS